MRFLTMRAYACTSCLTSVIRRSGTTSTRSPARAAKRSSGGTHASFTLRSRFVHLVLCTGWSVCSHPKPPLHIPYCIYACACACASRNATKNKVRVPSMAALPAGACANCELRACLLCARIVLCPPRRARDGMALSVLDDVLTLYSSFV